MTWCGAMALFGATYVTMRLAKLGVCGLWLERTECAKQSGVLAEYVLRESCQSHQARLPLKQHHRWIVPCAVVV